MKRLRAWAGRLEASTRWMLGLGAALVLVGALASRWHSAPQLLGGLALFPTFGLFILALRRLRFDLGTIAIVTTGLALYLVYLGYTEIGERNYDGPVQLEYIQWIATHHALPPPSLCLVCHHPPLYYGLAAAVLALLERTLVLPPILGLQLFSLAIFEVFVVYGVLLVRRFTADERTIRLATALVVFWPYSFHNCVRVHNDTLACTLMLAAVYHALVWWQERRPRELYLTAGLTAAALLTKSSALVLVALLVVLLSLALLRSRERLRLAARGGLAMCMVLAAMAGNAARKETPTGPPSLCERVLGSACKIERRQWVGNEPYNYLYFDLKSFLEQPYLIVEKENQNRELFWNDLMKTSLFGTNNLVPDRETAYDGNRQIAGVLNGLLLAMTGLLVLGAVHASRAAVRRYGVVLLAFGLFLAFLMGFRMLIPAPHHTDFRHVFPVLVLTSLLYAATIAHFERRGLALASAGRWLATGFVLLSIVYFLPKYELVVRFMPRTIAVPLASRSRVVVEGTPWAADGNLVIDGNQTLEFAVPGTRVTELDVSLDQNDRYAVVLTSKNETRELLLGPTQKKAPGMARYVEPLSPPVEGVTTITVHPVSGDRAYSIGHLLLR